MIGGSHGSTDVSIVTGSLVSGDYAGEIHVSVLDNSLLMGLALGILKDNLSKTLKMYGSFNAAIDGLRTTTSFTVSATNTGSVPIDLGKTYAPGYLESLGFDPNRLPIGFSAQRDVSGNLIGLAQEDHCFLAGTAISMWDGTKKPIELVQPGDIVTSYDKNGTLKPGRVKRTMTSRAKQILDVHGLMVTPGHATLCGDGLFAGRHVPIIDILRSDGALVLENGSMIRAATGCPLGSLGDRMVTAIVGEDQPGGRVKIAQLGQIRLGTRFIMASGEDVSVLDLIAEGGGMVTGDGMITTSPGGPEMPFRWILTPVLPKPEDYVLQRSATHLHDIYQADEWEAVRPLMPVPTHGEAGPSISRHPTMARAAPVNVPLSLRGHPDAPKMSRKYRRIAEAEGRKAQAAIH